MLTKYLIFVDLIWKWWIHVLNSYEPIKKELKPKFNSKLQTLISKLSPELKIWSTTMAFCLFAPHLDVHLGLKPIPVPDQIGLTPLCVQVALSKWIQHNWLAAACGIWAQLERPKHHSAYYCLNVKYVGSTFWKQWHSSSKKCFDSQCMHWTLKCNNTLDFSCHQSPYIDPINHLKMLRLAI